VALAAAAVLRLDPSIWEGLEPTPVSPAAAVVAVTSEAVAVLVRWLVATKMAAAAAARVLLMHQL
jgi:hypothetical protein